jgi:hypothetical protein
MPSSIALNQRFIGPPSIARLAFFARHTGPAILLTTTERLEEFRDIGIFSTKASFNPDLAEWSDKHEKIILSLDHALRPFPRNPDSVVLKFEKNKSYSSAMAMNVMNCLALVYVATPSRSFWMPKIPIKRLSSSFLLVT